MELTWCLAPFTSTAPSANALPNWWRWYQCNQQNIVDAGEADANELLRLVPSGQSVVLMVPPQWMSWHWIAWRPVRKSQELAYAQGVLGKALLNAQDAHVALGPLNGDKTGRWAAVTDLQPLKEQLQWLHSQQRKVTRIVPWWPAPQPDDTRPVWVVDAFEGQVLWHAWGHHKALSMHVDVTSLGTSKRLLDGWRANTVAAGWCGPSLAQTLQNELMGEETHYPMRVRNEAETLMAALESPWDLAQGALAPAPEQWQQQLLQGMKQWLQSPVASKTAAAVLGLLLINAMGLEWAHFKTQQQQAFWKAQQVRLAQEALPANTVLIDPMLQLRRAVASNPQADTAATTSRDPLFKALDAVAQSQGAKPAALVALQYEVNERITLVWNTPNPEALSTAKSLLANSPWQLDGSESEWTATAKR